MGYRPTQPREIIRTRGTSRVKNNECRQVGHGHLHYLLDLHERGLGPNAVLGRMRKLILQSLY